MKFLGRWWLVVGFSGLVASCQLGGVQPSSASPSDGDPIPPALAESLAVGLKVSTSGLSPQAAKGKSYRIAREMVYDMSGKPLHHLILLGPGTGEFWATLSAPDPEHALFAVGATDKRSFFSFIIPASSFKSIVETRDRAGSFKRFLSPTPGVLYLEDRSGRIWDTTTATEVDPAVVEQWRKAQRTLIEQRQKDGILDKMKEDWARVLAEASGQGLSPQSTGVPTLRALTLPDGSLDVEGFLTLLETQMASRGISPQYVNERAWCMGWFCAGMGYASVVRGNRYNGDIANDSLYNPNDPQDCSTQNKCDIANGLLEGDPFGNEQTIAEYRYLPDGTWGAWDFGPSGLMRLDYVGCGPMSIVRLFNWYAFHRERFGSGPNVHFVTVNGRPPSSERELAQIMFDPVLLGTRDGINYYQPRIARYTDTWHFVGQGMTRDTNMIPGANTWISYHASPEGKNWEMRGSHKAFVNLAYAGSVLTVVGIPISLIDFSQHTWRVRDIVRGKIGRDNEPVIALYATGRALGLEGHYAMSQAYIVHEGWFSASVLLWTTKGAGDIPQGRYVNVTDMGSFYSGAYGMYRR